MSVRLVRLGADFEQVSAALTDHHMIAIQQVHGNPPERYQIQYRIRSLAENANGDVVERTEHTVEFYLTLAYPRQAPQCRMLTPVFHPNIAPHAVCIGDHWAAGESLLQLIIRVGEMLAFQSYNIKSPLNGSAARWVEEHLDELPFDGRDLMPTGPTGTAGSSQPAAAGGCLCCGSVDRPLRHCAEDHEVCPECLVQCGRCNEMFCQRCRLSTCVICARLVCASCRSTCPQCERTAICTEHMIGCAVCGQLGCPDCSIVCNECGNRVCLTDIGRCGHCTEPVCRKHLNLCSGCQTETCNDHLTTCDQCGVEGCPDCIFECQDCGNRLCLDHVVQCAKCKQVLCEQHRQQCSKCGRSYCDDHLYSEQRICWDCGGRRPVIGP